MLKGVKTFKIALYILYFILIKTNLQAQEIGLKVGFFGYADNREYTAPFTTPKTIFGTRLSPELNLTLTDYHKIITGVHYKQDFGKHREAKHQADFIAYYNYENKKIDFSIGLIPRSEKLNTIPRLVLADTFEYDRPNIEGMSFKYKTTNFYQTVFIDWTSMQSKTQREQFLVGLTGQYRWRQLYLKNNALLFHNALTTNNLEDDHIQDNAVLLVNLGVDLSNKIFLDSLTFDIGFAGAYDRIRTEYTEKNYGFINNIHLGYKNFFLNNSIYIGQKLNLPNGDPFYKNGNYDRLDLGWVPFKTKAIEGKLTASFHFRSGGMDNQQAFTLRYIFGKTIWKEKRVN